MISYEPRRSEDGNQTRLPHETLGTESTIPTADLPWVHGRLRKLSAALLSLSIRLEMFSKYFTDRCFTEVTSLSSSRDGACAELRSVFQDGEMQLGFCFQLTVLRFSSFGKKVASWITLFALRMIVDIQGVLDLYTDPVIHFLPSRVSGKLAGPTRSVKADNMMCRSADVWRWFFWKVLPVFQEFYFFFAVRLFRILFCNTRAKRQKRQKLPGADMELNFAIKGFALFLWSHRRNDIDQLLNLPIFALSQHEARAMP